MGNDLARYRRLIVSVAALAIVALGLLPGLAAGAPATPSPTSVAFGRETVGKTSGPVAVTVSNLSPGAVQILGVSVIGTDPGDFLAGRAGCVGATLGEGQSCAVEVGFAPSAAGARNAVLQVTVEGEPPLEVPLAGTGQTMKLTVPPRRVSRPPRSAGRAARKSR